jgi:hypothetical protein
MKKSIVSIVVALVLITAAMPLAIASADTELPLDHVALSPTSVTLSINGTQQFTAVGQDSANITVTSVTYTWGVIAVSGNITASGLFTSGNTTGTSTVQVVATQDTITKTAFATVTVSTSMSDKEEDRHTPPGWEHGKKKGWGSKDMPPGWSKGNKKGWDDEGNPPGLMKAKLHESDDDESSE